MEESNLVKHAKNELKLLGGEDDEMQQLMDKDILQIVEIFANQGHSGFSASYAISILRRLLAFMPITPLTGEDDEWEEPDVDRYTQQNKSYSSVFRNSKTNESYDINAVTFYYGDDTSEWNRGGVRYGITFPYAPKESSIKLVLPKEYEDKSNEELLSYLKKHRTDSDQMEDLYKNLLI